MLDLRWIPPRLPFPARAAVLGVFTVFIGIGTAQGVNDRVPIGAVGAVVALAAGAVSLLGSPRACLPGAVASAAGIVALGTGQSFNVAWFGICVLVGWVVLAVPLWIGIAFWVVAELAIGAEALFSVSDPGWGAWAAGTLCSAIGCVLGQNQRQLVSQLQAAQHELAVRAQTEERNRIARELHDVIAHSLTVSLLHITSARLAVRDDPTTAESALAEAERLSRSSLEEARHTVGLLRDGADPTTPLPGSADLSELITRFRRAGGTVTGDIAPLDDVPAVVALAAYRIVQEALTNSLRHASSAPVRVDVVRSLEQITIEVDSAGRPARSDGSGHGVQGMIERAAASGGSCTAGPGGSGWLVVARLPLAAVGDAREQLTP